MYTENELIAKKKEIETSKTRLSELRGEEKGLIKQLKEWGCETLKQAKTKIQELKTQSEQQTKEIEKLSLELENKYANES